MRIVVVYDEAFSDSATDERDLLVQRDTVSEAIGRVSKSLFADQGLGTRFGANACAA